MTTYEDVIGKLSGARFFRADLHIHSYGGSHDVKDATMTANAIVQTAAREGLSLIAIADHNEIANVEAAIAAAEGTSVFVVPAVELSTPEGHLLCYLPSFEKLRQFHSKLSLADRGTALSRCQQSLRECLNLLQELEGFGVLAHVDTTNGFESITPGGSPHKVDVMCHPALAGIELKHPGATISYAEGDPDPSRVAIGRQRIERLQLGARQYLARVSNSDAHALVALGRNAANLQRVTRYKMETPSFEGLRVALEDADARVRIEEDIPQVIPRVVGVRMEGGFLTGETLHFSTNLSCIVGGRGTGKSTAIEAVRCLASDDSASGVIDTEVWPDELHLFWQDQAGRVHTLVRRKGGVVENAEDPDFGPVRFDIDCFGQGDAARISQEAKTEPLALLRYLDRFLDLKEALALEEQAREKLLSLQTTIEKAEAQVQQIPQLERALSTTQQQIGVLQKSAARELIELQQNLATEQTLRSRIGEKVKELRSGIESATPAALLADIRELAEPHGLAVGSAEFEAIVAGAQKLEALLADTEVTVESGVSAFEGLVEAEIARWKTKEGEAQKRVDDKRRELEALQIPFDMAYIKKLTKDEAQYKQSLKNLEMWKPYLEEQKRLRELALKDRWAARENVANLREAFGIRATATLRESLSDLQVTLKYDRNAYSPEATEQIIGAMGWRTNQQQRAAWLTEKVTVPALLRAIQKKDIRPITAVRTPEGVPVFSAADAEELLTRLAEPTIRYALERAVLYDRPRLTVARVTKDGSGKAKAIVREFTKLSLGQQQSVMLALMLSSNSNKPLIIDQPEDNLDGEFIYSTLIPVLRRAKERRQVIIVTHNANVAVLGDAELVLVMRATSDFGKVVQRGSIDHGPTRDVACAILEGAREAFLRRAKMYGIRVRV